MWKDIMLLPVIIITNLSLFAQHATSNLENIRNYSYGLTPPSSRPEIFAPGIISTNNSEFGIAFSPDGEEIYFGRQSGSGVTTVKVIKFQKGKWSNAETASFSGTDYDMDPSISCDGKIIFFGSMRSNGNPNAIGCDIWYAERIENGNWSDAVNTGKFINTDDNENFPSIACNGTLYFHSKKHKGEGGLDIFRSELVDGVYSKPQNLGETINFYDNDFDAFIASDESYLIFSSRNRPGGYGSGDLYISYQEKDGSWTKAVNMGKDINSKEMEYSPKVSPDGRYLFFSSLKDGVANIYWVDAEIINQLKPEK